MVDALFHYLENPEWRRQHRWRRAIWMSMSRMGLTGLHALPLNRRWVEIHRRRMPLAGLDPSLSGLKMVQISDLHYSPVVWERYLLQFIRWVNDLKPDVVVVTGDLIHSLDCRTPNTVYIGSASMFDVQKLTLK